MTLPEPVSPEKQSLGRRIPKALSNAAERLVDSLKVNSVSEQVRHGRRLMNKRRTVYSEPLAELANVYFRMAGIPIRFWAKAENWRRWEVECFKMLNGDRFRAWASGDKTVCADKLPGKSLWEHLEDRRLSPEMVEAYKRLGEPSAEIEERFQDMIARKREEFNARRRSRKDSGRRSRMPRSGCRRRASS